MSEMLAYDKSGEPITPTITTPFGVNAKIENNRLYITDSKSRRNADYRDVAQLEIKYGIGSFLDISWYVKSSNDDIYGIVWLNDKSNCMIFSISNNITIGHMDNLSIQLKNRNIPKEFQNIKLTCKLKYDLNTKSHKRI